MAGVPPRDTRRAFAILDLQHVYALQHAAELFAALGWDHDAQIWADRAKKIRAQVISSCGDESRQLLADTSGKLTFSQHANTFLILTAGEKKSELTTLALRLRDKPDLTPATFYFVFYTHQALVDAGRGEDYSRWLDLWRSVLDEGLATIPEKSTGDTRSDYHAWGAHPVLGLLTTICGITPLEPGFNTMRIAPISDHSNLSEAPSRIRSAISWWT
jgi:alpha-L-rhamnosidase